MAAPTINLYTGAIPDRANDSATEFSDNADDMVTYIAEIPDQYNDLAEFVNSAASSAQAAANFEGSWSDLSGAYPAGISVEHNGSTWLLLAALADITASEPTSSNSNWQELASFAQQDQNTDDIAEINENLQVENRFKGNQNWNVEGSTGSELPSAVARTYTDGEEIAAGRFADGNVVNATLVDYAFDADSGTYYIEYDGDFTDNFYGLKLADGSTTQTGCTLSLVGGNTRLSVDMAVAPAHKFPILSEFAGLVSDINDDDSERAWRGGYLLIEDATGYAKIFKDGTCEQIINGTFDSGDSVGYIVDIDSTDFYSIQINVESVVQGVSCNFTSPTDSGFTITLLRGDDDTAGPRECYISVKGRVA